MLNLVTLFILSMFGQHRLVLGLKNEYAVSENVRRGHTIVNLAQALGVNMHSQSQTLAITNSQSSEGAKYFSINPIGILIVTSPPDRDKMCEHKINCIVELMIAHGDARNPEVSSLRIRLIDVNDNAPVFPDKSIELKIREEMRSTLVQKTLPAAYDIDKGISGEKIKYELDGQPDETMPFSIHVKDDVPQLSLSQKLDRERKASYKFRVLAKDGGQPEQTGTLSVRVTVEDVNDHKPEFTRTSYSKIIDENVPPGTTILTLEATDKDAGSNGRVGFRMARPRNREESYAVQYFDVYNNGDKASVVVKKAIDIDKRTNLLFKFTVIAYDQGANPLESEAKVIIRVRDINDDKPRISINYRRPDGLMKTRGLLYENEEKFFIALITVTDRDSGPGGIVSCKVNSDYFYLEEIERNNGGMKSENKWQEKKYKLLTRHEIDRETTPEVSFIITCHDNAIAQKAVDKLVSTARIQLRIMDKNDEKPEFTKEHYTFYLQENVGKINPENHVQVGQVIAKDKDEGENAQVSYSLVDDINNAFMIDKTGVVYAKRSFDREHTAKVDLKVKAVDNGSPRQTGTAGVTVIISDVNDNPPVFKASDYHFTVVENSKALQVGKVEAVDEDRDANAQIEYRITDTNPATRKYFSINRSTGIIHLNSRLDRERHEQYVFNVVAVDKPNQGKSRNTGSATVTVSVLDENDNHPRIISPLNNDVKELLDTDPIGKDVFTMKAEDPDEGVNGTVHYDVVKGSEGYFAIDKTAGIFYVTRKLEGLHNKLFSVVLVASDSGREVQLNSTITVRIRVVSRDHNQIIPTEHEAIDSGDTGRTLIVVAAIVLLLLVLAAVALLIMLRMRRVPHSTRRSPTEDMKRKWKNGFPDTVTDTYICPRNVTKPTSPKCAGAVMDDEKVDEYLLESPTLRSKDTGVNYNSLNFYKGDPGLDKSKPYHTYYEVAKPTEDDHRILDNYVPIDRDELGHDGLSAQKSPFLGDMRLPGLCDSEMTVVGTMRRHEKPLTPYIEASFV